jgi:hypothetical protein
MPGAGVQRFEPPVIEDQQVDGAEACKASRQAAIAVGEDQIGRVGTIISKGGRHHDGIRSQEVQKVLPSIVLTENNAEKTLGIKYTELIPVLTKAVQEQQAEIDALKAQVAALEARR